MGEISTGEAGGIFAGAVALAALVGSGIRWMIGWRDSRQDLREKQLAAWEDRLRERDEEYHARVEERLEAAEDRLGIAEKKVSVMGAALFATIAEVQLLDPASPALARARAILQQAYPVPTDMPEDIAALVQRLARAGGH